MHWAQNGKAKINILLHILPFSFAFCDFSHLPHFSSFRIFLVFWKPSCCCPRVTPTSNYLTKCDSPNFFYLFNFLTFMSFKTKETFRWGVSREFEKQLDCNSIDCVCVSGHSTDSLVGSASLAFDYTHLYSPLLRFSQVATSHPDWGSQESHSSESQHQSIQLFKSN